MNSAKETCPDRFSWLAVNGGGNWRENLMKRDGFSRLNRFTKLLDVSVRTLNYLVVYKQPLAI